VGCSQSAPEYPEHSACSSVGKRWRGPRTRWRRRRPAFRGLNEHRMGRNFLKGAHGDAANAVLAAAGYNFRRLLAWLAALWRVLIAALLVAASEVNLAVYADL
jgi:hypothetical protein